MIYTVTLNPAIDRELTVPDIRFGAVLRAEESRVDFGGKGFNVSRLLHQMSTTSTAIGFLGGYAGPVLQDGLRSLGILTDLVWVPGETRTNVSIVTPSHKRYVKVNEAGPVIGRDKQEELIRRVESLAREGDWWVLAGSLPPGLEADFYAKLIEVIGRQGGRAVLDCAGEALQLGCTIGPYLVKPNEEEARTLAGLRVATTRTARSGQPTTGRRRLSEAAEAARRIRQMGAQNVVVSMGKEGAVLRTAEEAWFVRSPGIREKNPIGAGDAMVGGMVWALCGGRTLREAVGWGVASGAATASLAGTEVGSREIIEQLFERVRYEELG